MSDAEVAIIADIAGRAERLVALKQWRSVINRRQIVRDTPVRLEYASGRLETKRAGDCALLQPLFDDILGPVGPPVREEAPARTEEPVEAEDTATPSTPLAVVATSTSTEDVESSGMVAEPAMSEYPAATQSRADPVAEEEIGPESVQDIARRVHGRKSAIGDTRRGKKSPWGGRIVFALLFIGAAFLVRGLIPSTGLESPKPTTPAQATRPTRTTAVPVDNPSPAATTAPIELATSFYAARTIPVRMQPEDSSLESTSLSRGDAIMGVPAGEDWVRITSGSAVGNFVRRGSLRTDAPPAIDTATAGEYFLMSDAAALSEPLMGAATVTNYPTGTKLIVKGTVNGYAELEIGSTELGYISWSAFGGVGGRGERHFVRLVNNCSAMRKVILSASVDGEWHGAAGYWAISPGTSVRLNLDDSQMETDSQEIYYGLLDPAFGGSVTLRGKDEAFVDGRIRVLKRAVPALNSDGEAVISFC